MSEKTKFALPPAVTAQLSVLIKAGMVSLGSTLLVDKGWLSNEQLQQVIGALFIIGGVAWAAWKNRPQGLINSAAKLDQVETITTTKQSTADAAPDNVKGPVDVLKATTSNGTSRE